MLENTNNNSKVTRMSHIGGHKKCRIEVFKSASWRQGNTKGSNLVFSSLTIEMMEY